MSAVRRLLRVPMQMADDVAAVCRALGIERSVVFGESLRGVVAIYLALGYPERVGKLILAHMDAVIADMAGGLEMLKGRYGSEVRAAAERMFDGDLSDESLSEFGRLVWPTYVSNPANVPALADIVPRSMLNIDVAARYFQFVHPSHDLRPSHGEIHAPALVITVDWNGVIHSNASRALAAAIPIVELLVLPRSGHSGYIDRPATRLPPSAGS